MIGTSHYSHRGTAPLRWKHPLSALRGQTVRLQFALRNARLFGFDVQR